MRSFFNTFSSLDVSFQCRTIDNYSNNQLMDTRFYVCMTTSTTAPALAVDLPAEFRWPVEFYSNYNPHNATSHGVEREHYFQKQQNFYFHDFSNIHEFVYMYIWLECIRSDVRTSAINPRTSMLKDNLFKVTLASGKYDFPTTHNVFG